MRCQFYFGRGQCRARASRGVCCDRCFHFSTKKFDFEFSQRARILADLLKSMDHSSIDVKIRRINRLFLYLFEFNADLFTGHSRLFRIVTSKSIELMSKGFSEPADIIQKITNQCVHPSLHLFENCAKCRDFKKNVLHLEYFPLDINKIIYEYGKTPFVKH